MDFGVELLSVVKDMVVMLEILQNAQVITFLLNRVTSYNKNVFNRKDAHQPVFAQWIERHIGQMYFLKLEK